MMGALFTGTALQGGLKLSRGVLIALAIGALFATGGFGFWRGMTAIERMETRAAEAATRQAEAEFKAAIEASNARVEQLRAAQAIEAARASSEAEKEITGLRARLTDMEKANVALPNGAAGGLDRARVRLLR